MICVATPEGIKHVAKNLRPSEIVVKQLGPARAAAHCVDVAMASDWRWQVVANGKPVAVFGGDANPGDAECSVWLFCSNGIEENPWELFSGIRKCIRWGKAHWPALVIGAEPRSPEQKRFLALLGFQVRTAFARDGRMYEELVI